jgi:small subunit ribosomal protein S6
VAFFIHKDLSIFAPPENQVVFIINHSNLKRMQRNYETVFIMTPVLSDDQMKETVQKFRNFLKDNGANIIFEDNWGLRKLAYPIQKKSTGFYHLVEFAADPNLIRDWEVTFKRDERILRFLTVSLDKHAVAYNEKKRKNKAEKEKVEEKAEA